MHRSSVFGIQPAVARNFSFWLSLARSWLCMPAVVNLCHAHNPTFEFMLFRPGGCVALNHTSLSPFDTCQLYSSVAVALLVAKYLDVLTIGGTIISFFPCFRTWNINTGPRTKGTPVLFEHTMELEQPNEAKCESPRVSCPLLPSSRGQNNSAA
jgi:hypothetical protein